MKPPVPLFPSLPIGLRILDVSAGNGAIWFGERPASVVAVDRRSTPAATVRADSRFLPFAAASFDLAVFDPPHTNFGPGSQMSERYGHSKMDEIRDLLASSSGEIARCVCPGGLMAFKWNDRDIALSKALSLLPHWRPLFGHHVQARQRRAHHNGISKTYWLMMLNQGDPPDDRTARSTITAVDAVSDDRGGRAGETGAARR